MNQKIKFYFPLNSGKRRDRKYWNILVQSGEQFERNADKYCIAENCNSAE
jgi:hypothetical protein